MPSNTLQSLLTAEDRIVDGFHDAGRSTTYISLESVRHRPIDLRREVLLVDSTVDKELRRHIAFARQCALEHEDVLKFIEALSNYVCDVLGGARPRDDAQEFNYSMHIAELKLAISSSVLCLGSIHTGTYYHRALLFKVLCDRSSHPLGNVSLVRGRYARAWNLVQLQRTVYVVDLMHAPGTLVD